MADEQDYATVSGTKVHRSDFAYAPPGSGPSEWKLPIHDANHVRNALARYSQTELPGDAKAGVWRKIVAAAKRFEVHVSDESSENSPQSAQRAQSSRTKNQEQRTTNQACVYTTRLTIALAEPILRAGRPFYEHPVCITGSWVKDGHKIDISKADLESMVDNLAKRGNHQVPFDYEHASENPEVSRGGPIPAAGWIHELRVGANGQGDTLYALVEWTPEAVGMIRAGQYRFVSPAIDWSYADKETGKPQGATLTSCALTNHPFLDALPALQLTDKDFADVSTGYLDAPVRAVSVAYPKNGGTAKMASKKLSVKKLEGDDFKDAQFEGGMGHHGIFDGKDYLGHIHADDLKDYVKARMDDGFGDLDGLMPKEKGQAGIPGHQKVDDLDKDGMSELLRESGFRSSGDSTSAVREALKLAATHQLVEQREASRNLLLSECLGGEKPQFNTEKAKQLLRDNKINAADLLDAIEAKGMLDDAVTKGKVLPKDRAFFFEIAFNNPKKFTDYIASAVPVVQFGAVGMGSTENLPVDQEVDIETRKLMSEQKLSYGQAMKALFKTNPTLEHRYREAHRAQPRSDAPVN